MNIDTWTIVMTFTPVEFLYPVNRQLAEIRKEARIRCARCNICKTIVELQPKKETYYQPRYHLINGIYHIVDYSTTMTNTYHNRWNELDILLMVANAEKWCRDGGSQDEFFRQIRKKLGLKFQRYMTP